MIIIDILTVLECITAVLLYDYADQADHNKNSLSADDLEFEPVITLTKDKEKKILTKNIDCDDFPEYSFNCTVEAALMYNSSKKAPPLPSKVMDWCRAIRHLTNCAIDWNSDCKDVTDSHFNEESIRGHMHVISNVCDDEGFLSRYDVLSQCIEGTKGKWENCYSIFKKLVDDRKNTTHEWTHFEIHFYLCCARAQFRRCTLDIFFDLPEICPYEHAVTLQKFSIIVSEGDVYQDCDHNMMYANCPGGDPRPTGNSLNKYITSERIIVRSNVYAIESNPCFLHSVLNLYVLLIRFLCD